MKTLLFVDNDSSPLFPSLNAFDSQEFQVVSASSHMRALWALCEHKVDLVLIDLGLPERQSFELLAYLAHHRPHVPVLTMSDSTQPWDEREASPWSGHLWKPLRGQSLLSRVRKCLRDLELGKHPCVTLQAFLQLLLLERKSCLLRVKRGMLSGQIQLVRGIIVHAACGRAVGEEALRELKSWWDASFDVEPIPARLLQTLQRQASTAERAA